MWLESIVTKDMKCLGGSSARLTMALGSPVAQGHESKDHVTRVSAEFIPTGETIAEWHLHRERAISGHHLMFPDPLASPHFPEMLKCPQTSHMPHNH